MKDKVTVKMRQCDRELSALPPVVTADPVGHTIALVTSFSQLIAEHVSGSTTLVTLVQKNNVAYDNYKTEIARTAPKFLPYPRKSVIDLDDSYQGSYRIVSPQCPVPWCWCSLCTIRAGPSRASCPTHPVRRQGVAHSNLPGRHWGL